MATMHDVARRAKVSIATVSAVLNRSSYVSPELTRRVLHAASALDYQINTLARALKQGSTRTAGILIPGFALPDPFFPEVAEGAEAVLRASGYSLLLGLSHNQAAEQARHIAAFRARFIDGLLLFQAPGPDAELGRMLADRKPVVFLGRLPQGIAADAVATDIEAGTHLGTAHLLARGRRRVALLVQTGSLSVGEFRRAGWRRAHREAGRSAAATLIAEAPLDAQAARQAAHRLFSRRSAPDAIFVDNLVHTTGVVQALQELGLLETVEILSSDDAAWLDVFQIPISTIVQPSHEVGRAAAGLLLRRLADPERSPETILLPPRLRLRPPSAHA